jgi:hypothetical protein
LRALDHGQRSRAQAKSADLTRPGRNETAWTRVTSNPFDYAYRAAPSSAEPDPPTPLLRLLDSSDRLGVPAAYLFASDPPLGLPDDWACQTIPRSWRSAGVTFLAAAIVHERSSRGFDLDLGSVHPIDCLACDGRYGDDMARLAGYSQNLATPKFDAHCAHRPRRPPGVRSEPCSAT